MARERLAALDSRGVWLEGLARPLPIQWESARSAADLFAGLLRREAHVLHVHSSALAPLGLPAALPAALALPPHPFFDVSWRGQPLSHRTLAPAVTALDNREILIGAYQLGTGDIWEAAANGRELLDAAIAFRDAFPFPWTFRHSAQLTGWRLMHACWSTATVRGRRLAAVGGLGSPELPSHPALAEGQAHEQPYGGAFTRARSGRPLEHVHVFDINGQRLAACGRLALGAGPVDVADPERFDPARPGYHLIGRIRRAHSTIPPIFEAGWHTTPRVAAAIDMGLRPVIRESYVWRSSVQYLSPWYESLREARRALLANESTAARIALGVLKQCYLQPLGRLRSARARQFGSEHYRPDWYDHVIGHETARQYRHMDRMATAGARLLAVYFDAVAIESAEPDAAAAAAAAGIEVSDQLGKFKHAGTITGQLAHEALYGNGAPDVGQLMNAIREAAEC
jgi:hypothetical protein